MVCDLLWAVGVAAEQRLEMRSKGRARQRTAAAVDSRWLRWVERRQKTYSHRGGSGQHELCEAGVNGGSSRSASADWVLSYNMGSANLMVLNAENRTRAGQLGVRYKG
jgi:hypothetical protein